MASGRRTPTSRSSSTSRPAARTPRTTSRSSGPTKYKGKFDQGWDRLREETFARQKALGVVPADAELTPRNAAFPAWDDVPDKLKPFYARQMEVFAGYSENADHNVGRVIDAIDELGELDNTLVIWIWGDNGASMEGTLTGSFNELTMQNGIPLTDEMQLQLAERYGGLDAWGEEIMAPHYAAAWAWAGNTPFQWGKQVASHLGGTRDPLVVHWPARVTDRGALAVAVDARDRHRPDDPRCRRHPGPDDRRWHRPAADPRDDVQRLARATRTPRSTARSSTSSRSATGPCTRTAGGSAMKTARIPWVVTPDAIKPFAPGRLGSGRRPDRALLPARTTSARRATSRPTIRTRSTSSRSCSGRRRSGTASCRSSPRMSAYFGQLPPLPDVARFEFRGDVQNVLPGMIPRIYNHSYSISADLVVPAGGRRGRDRGRSGPSRRVLAVGRGRQADPHLLDDGRVHLPPAGDRTDADRRGHGPHGVRSRWRRSRRPAGQVTLFVNDRAVGGGRMDHTVPVRFSAYAGMDIGRDNGGVVDPSLRVPKAVRLQRDRPQGRLRHQAARRPRPRRSCTRSRRAPRPATR